MKRTFAAILSSFFIFMPCMCTSGSAAVAVEYEYDAEQNESFAEEYNDIVSVYTGSDVSEEKVFCTASVNDRFVDDKVIVVLNNEASLDIDGYEKEFDFEYEKIMDLTAYKYEDVCDDYEDALKEVYQQSFDATPINDNLKINSLGGQIKKSMATKYAEDRISEDFDYFHRILQIDLGVKEKENVLDVIQQIEQYDGVLAAEPDYIVTLPEAEMQLELDVQTEGYDEKQELSQVQNSKSEIAVTGTNDPVLVGVIDSGIYANHPLLSGHVDTTLSYSFIDSYPLQDGANHGTLVAGIIGDVYGTNNVFSTVKLVSMKVLDSNGSGYISDCVSAIGYAQENNISIINFSISSSGSTAMQSAIGNYSGLLVCSAGNGNKDVGIGLDIDDPNSGLEQPYPSLYTNKNIISVASVNSSNVLAASSNYGTTSVDIAARGVSVKSTSSSGGYKIGSGTSFAAPQVTRAAARILSNYPTMEYIGMRKAILDSASKLVTPKGKIYNNRLLAENAAVTFADNQIFTFRYHPNGGSGTMADTVITYAVPTALRANAYTKPLYRFKGWFAYREYDKKWKYKDAQGNGGWYTEGAQPSGYTKHLFKNEHILSTTSSYKNDIVHMYAQWEYIKYTVRLTRGYTDSNPIYTDVNITVSYNQNLTLPENTMNRYGYDFDGWTIYNNSTEESLYSDNNWYTEGQQPNSINKKVYYPGDIIRNLTTVDGTVFLFSVVWKPREYEITYDPNGGTGVMNTTIGMTNTDIQLQANTFTRTGFSFIGWYIVDDYGYWSLAPGDIWEQTIPTGYDYRLYTDESCVNFFSESGEGLTAIAQWQWNILGDIDYDGELSIFDVVMLQRYLAKIDNLSAEQLRVADYNQDGMVDIYDVTGMQNALAGP